MKRKNIIIIFLVAVVFFTMGHFSTYTFYEPGLVLNGNYQSNDGPSYTGGGYELVFLEGKFYEHVNDQYTDIGEYHKIIDNVYALKSESKDVYITLLEDDSFYFQSEPGVEETMHNMISISKVPTFYPDHEGYE